MKFNGKQILLAGSAIAVLCASGMPVDAATIEAGTTQTVGATQGADGAPGALQSGDSAVQFTAPQITVTGSGLLKGGAGGPNNAPGSGGGGNGGVGVDFNNQSGMSGALTSLVNDGGVTGGAGSAGAGGSSSSGGAGGNGAAAIFENADFSSVTGGGAVTGGAGGDGGNGDGVNNGGAGGAGGAGIESGGSNQSINDSGVTIGGAGGNGGVSGGGNSVGGNGGDGGNGYDIQASNTQVTVSGNVTGGAGGAGGAALTSSGAAGNGGAGGAGINLSGAADTLTIGSGATVAGGLAGAAGAANGGTAGSDGTAADGIDVAGPGGDDVTNNGTVAGGNGFGIVLQADTNSLVNAGTISSAANPAAVGVFGMLGTLDNDSGIISATGSGAAAIYNGGGTIGTITNNGGQISGAAYGILNISTISSAIDNDGGMISSDGGRAIDNEGTLPSLTNNGGTIQDLNGGFAIYNGGTLTSLDNTGGSVSATTGYGIYVAGTASIGTLTNGAGGSITATTGNAVRNDGTIAALDNNGGIISSDGGRAIDVSGTITSLTNDGGTIEDTGAGYAVVIDPTGVITTFDNTNGQISSGFGSIYVEGTLGTLLNAGGTISSNGATVVDTGSITTLNNNGGLITNDNNSTIDNLGFLGTITNDGGTIQNTIGNVSIFNGAGHTIGMLDNTGGLITGGLAAIENDGIMTTLKNNGGTISTTINGDDAIANTSSGTLGTLDNDNGTIISAGGRAVDNEGTITTLTNNGGTIQDMGGGVGVYNATGETIATLDNAGGTISSVSGSGVENHGTITALTNTGGTIDGGTGYGLALFNPIGTLDNTGGVITSASTGGSGAAVALLADLGAGGQDLGDGTISNTGGGTALAIDADQSGTITNGGAISAAGGTAVEFGGSAAFVNNGTLTGAMIDDAGQNVTLANAGTVDGNITLDGDGSHILTSSGDITGNVILSGSGAANSLTLTGGTLTGAVSLTGTGATNALVLDGGIIYGNTTIGTGTLTFARDYITGGTFTGTAANTTLVSGATVVANNDMALGAGTLDIHGTLDANMGAVTTTGATTVYGDGALTIVSAGDSVGALTQDGTVKIAAGRTLTASSYTAAAGSNLHIGLSSNGAANNTGELIASTGTIDLAQTTLHIDVANGTRAILLGSAGATSITHNASGAVETVADDPLAILDNSFLYNFIVDPGTGTAAGDLVLTAVEGQSLAVQTDSRNNFNVANALFNGLAGSGDPQIIQLQNHIAAAPTRQQFNDDLKTLLPPVGGGEVQAAMDVANAAFDVAGGQMSMLRADDTTGMAAGDPGDGLRGWTQTFGAHADQADRFGVSGYTANIYGGSAGFDSQDLLPDAILGASFSYGHAHVNGNGNDEAEVNSYQATLYGSQYLTGIGRNLFVDGMLAAGYQRNDESRADLGGVTGLGAHGDYNSYDAAGRAELGRDFDLPQAGGMILTPSLITDYTYYRSDSYAESGAGGAGLDVDSSAENIWNIGFGIQASWLFREDNGSYLKPDIRASYKYDVLNDDRVDVDSSFQAGGPAFSTDGLDPSNHTVNAGFDVRFYTASNWELSGSYDFTWKPDFTDNSGQLRAAYQF